MNKLLDGLSEAILEDLLKEEIEKRARVIRDDLIEFACYVDPLQERWYRAKHLRKIGDALMRVAEEPNQRLIINVPPRHWKSSLSSEKFPTWYIGKHPERSVILASWGLSLAASFSRRIRDTVMTNEKFRLLFPKCQVRPDRTWVEDWATTQAFRSTLRPIGVGGGISGFGANLVIIDDPIENYEAAQSVTVQKMMWNWYRSALRTRFEPGASAVIIMTRWNDQDLVGKLIDAEKNEGGEHWEVIEISAENGDGTFLWEDRYPHQEYLAIKSTIGDFAWRAQFLCKPGSDEGAEIKSTWFKYFDKLPDKAEWQCRAWDLAITEKQVDKPNPDFTATCVSAITEGALWLGKPRLFRANWTKVISEIKSTYDLERKMRHGTGQSAIETAAVKALLNEGVKLEAVEERKHGDHRARAATWMNWARTGRINLVGTQEEWDSFMAQWKAFPAGHDDAVDVVSDLSLMHNLTFNPVPHVQHKQYDKDYLDLLNTLGKVR